MADLQGKAGELSFTVQVTRKETGLVETYELIGQITDEQLKEIQDGSHALDSSPQRSD